MDNSASERMRMKYIQMMRRFVWKREQCLFILIGGFGKFVFYFLCLNIAVYMTNRTYFISTVIELINFMYGICIYGRDMVFFVHMKYPCYYICLMHKLYMKKTSSQYGKCFNNRNVDFHNRRRYCV